MPLLTRGGTARELEGLVDRMRRPASAATSMRLAEDDVAFRELVIERSVSRDCLQIWRTIEPRVRAYFRRDAPVHPRAGEIADEHDALVQALRPATRRA